MSFTNLLAKKVGHGLSTHLLSASAAAFTSLLRRDKIPTLNILRPFQFSGGPLVWDCASFCYRNELASSCNLICHLKDFVCFPTSDTTAVLPA